MILFSNIGQVGTCGVDLLVKFLGGVYLWLQKIREQPDPGE